MTAKPVKCLVWDLDETLWTGTLAEGDRVTLRPEAEAVVRELDRRGVLQSVASKNDPDEAERTLRALGVEEFFLGPRIGWGPKSESVQAVAEQLNLGLDAVAFVDDSPFEREEVSFALPEVRCLDACEVGDFLERPEFQPAFVTQDSRRRREMYAREVRRRVEEDRFPGPPQEFLARLEMELAVEAATEADLDRVLELVERTNRFNATGRLYSRAELQSMLGSNRQRLAVLRLRDRLGSYGSVGAFVVEVDEQSWRLPLFLISCRVMGRGVGSALLSYLISSARRAGKDLLAELVRTERNRQMNISYRLAGFTLEVEREGDRRLLQHQGTVPQLPDHLVLLDGLALSGQVQREVQLLTLSACDRESLERVAAGLQAELEQGLGPAALRLQRQRPELHRLALAVSTTEQARRRLGKRLRPVRALTGRRLGFLFTGLGDQFPAMAEGLYRGEPVFRYWMDRCIAFAEPHLGGDLRLLMRQDEPPTPVVHCGLFAVQYALARTLMEWGLRPDFSVGYSLGEYLCACLAEVFSLQACLEIVIRRAAWMDSLPEGGMRVVPMAEEELAPYLEGRLEVVIRNGPEVCVVAGGRDEVEALGRRLWGERISSLPVKNRHPVHSAWMEPIRGQLTALIAKLGARSPSLPFTSNLTGDWITDSQATDPEYWGRHLTRPADFSGVLATVWGDGAPALAELGPGGTLSLLARQHPRAPRDPVTASLLATRQADDQATLLQGLGHLWEAGLEPEWKAFHTTVRPSARVPNLAL